MEAISISSSPIHGDNNLIVQQNLCKTATLQTTTNWFQDQLWLNASGRNQLDFCD